MNNEHCTIDWLPINGRIVYDNRWIRVIETIVADARGNNQHIYSIVHFKNYAIGIVPITEKKEVFLVG